MGKHHLRLQLKNVVISMNFKFYKTLEHTNQKEENREKKLLITISLLLIYSIPATAEARIYFEKMVSGVIDEEFGNNDPAFDTDSTINIIGMEWAGKRFLIRGEMGVDTLKIPKKVDFNTTEFMIGVRLVNKKRFKWGLDLCYQNTELGNTAEQFSGCMWGTDLVWGTEKSNLSFLFLLPLSGNTKIVICLMRRSVCRLITVSIVSIGIIRKNFTVNITRKGRK